MGPISKILEKLGQVETRIEDRRKGMEALKEASLKDIGIRENLKAELKSHLPEGLPDRWVICGKKVVNLSHPTGYVSAQVYIYDAEVEE